MIRFNGRVGTTKCYAATGGCCWLKVDGVADPMRLEVGDTLGSARHSAMVVHGGGGDAMLAGNRFEVDGRKAKALLGALAPVVHLRAAED